MAIWGRKIPNSLRINPGEAPDLLAALVDFATALPS
jgi:hypothetical protein